MTKLISYHNNPKLKADFVREIEKHRKADQIVQRTYGRENGGWKGCAVACSLRSLAILDGETPKIIYNQHVLYETKLGIPKWLAYLEDTIFEGLPKTDSKKWPTQFAKAVPVGVNLEPVKYKFGKFLMKENIARVKKLKIDDVLKRQVLKAIQGVLKLHEEAIVTGIWDESAAESVASTAWRAENAAWRADSTVKSVASAVKSVASAVKSVASAERSTAWSVENAAWRTAWRTARRTAWSAESAVRAKSVAYQRYAKKLLELLRETK